MTVKQNHFGDVTLVWREPMTLVEVADFEEFLEIWMRGVKRRAEAEAAKQPVTE